ncbi:UBX domain-containing protein 4-like isoform X1 [Diorhabda carinulata]|uniref:UBX domain-containing protein 4-like isoform X1 n=1 Tax=Diorhabda carinulata TaxID=1163345 RepID=UPI0025A15B74|nr:UBX domain-containing protein 4-like isoform X1 [Diorhabda carinulata]
MKWYNGDISEAVSYSKSKGAIFVVYIEGSDENSEKITNLIDNGEFGQKLEQDNFVCIKVKAGSTSHQQFGEIYKEPSVPSVYFIGKSGVPLDIITGSTNLDDISSRINDILSRANITQLSSQSTSASDDFINQEKSNSSSSMKCENGVCRIVSDKDGLGQEKLVEKALNQENSIEKASNQEKAIENPSHQEKPVEEKNSNEAEFENKKPDEVKEFSHVVKDSSNEVDISCPSEINISSTEDMEEKKEVNSSTTNEELSVQEKMDRAKELIESKRQQKEKEEQENERLKELERRKMGQNVQQLKKWQEDQELKQLIEDRDKEKRENQLARERVLAQIAQDRAERLSKSQPTPKVTEPSKATPSPPKPAGNVTRLQFKLPEGSSVTKEFQISDKLEYVVSFVKSDLRINNFTLATTFPRKEFTKTDYPSSLLDLQLVPNAVILILPINGSGIVATHSGEGFISSLFWSFLTPIFNLFGYIKSFIFGSNSTQNERNITPPNEPAETTGKFTNKRKGGGDSTVVRRHGNIHRLADRQDSDDENSTYNGNSTQQM